MPVHEPLDVRQEADALTHEIIGAAIEVHRMLGAGLLESTYEECLAIELDLRGIPTARGTRIPIVYKGRKVRKAYVIDLLVDKTVIVELKTVEKLLPVHEAQILTYMKHSGYERGLLINFNERVLKNGLRRFNRTRVPADVPSRSV